MRSLTIPTSPRRLRRMGAAAVLLLLWSPVLRGQDIRNTNTQEIISGPARMNLRGVELMEEKRYAEAKICFHRAAEAMPDNKFYYNNLAAACINLGQYNEARGHLKKALGLDPRYPKALSNMAVSCFYLFRFSEAYRYYRLALSADPLYARNRFEKHRVIKKLETIKENKPGNPELEALLDYLKTAEDMP